MIIGIAGKMGSGKNLVCKIIQYLLCKNVGDVTIKDIASCEDHNWWLEEQSGFEQKAFAGKLKQIASLLTGVPVEKFEDQEFKQKHMGLQWKMTYREFLQKLGTEAMRDGLHPNVWVNALFADYKDVYAGSWGQGHYMYEKPNWIITDMRFPNELEAVEEREGITIRVVRGCSECGGIGYHKLSCSKQYEKQHPSETALDDAKFDYEIINDGSMEDLIEKVKQILITEKII